MARTIDLRTELPGPRSRGDPRAQGARDRRRQEHLPADRDRSCPWHRRHRCRRQHLPRLDRRHRLPQRRPHQRGGVGGAAPAGRPLPAHRLHDGALRVVRRAGRAAARAACRSPAPKKAAFFNSGAEAVENAVKFAKLATGRPAVIAFERAFHGRTLMAMSLTSKQHPYKAGMGPFAPEVYRAPYPYAYRDRGDDPAAEALAELREHADHPRRRRERWRPSSSSRCRARAASSCRRRSGCGACARSPTSTASC